MKEITRRLYTKPVMLGMAFLMGMALVVGLFVTTKSDAAQSAFPVVAGNDEFETTAQRRNLSQLRGLSHTRGLLRGRFSTIRRASDPRRRASAQR